MKRFAWLFFALLVAVTVHAAAQTTARTIVATSLTNAPYSDAMPVAAVPANTGVTILSRQGGWYHVRLANGRDGWLQMTSIQLNSTRASSSWGFGWLSQLFESGRAGATGTTATTGVRGLNKGSIANARPNPQAVDELNNWTVTPDQARSFAARLGLKSEQVPYLPVEKGGE